MKKDLVVHDDDFVDNPSRRVPVCILLDTSGSMRLLNHPQDKKTKIAALEDGLSLFYNELQKNMDAKYSADIAVITFGSNQAKIIEDFGLVGNKKKLRLKAEGKTALGAALQLGYDILQKRKAQYKKHGSDYYQPWLLILTDGMASDRDKVIEMIPRLNADEKARKLTVYPVAIGNRVDLPLLNELSLRGAFKLDGIKFNKLFEWLSESITHAATSSDHQATEKETEKRSKHWMDQLDDDDDESN